MGQEEERAGFQEKSNFLFLNFFVKPLLLQNQIYLKLQSFIPLVCCSWVENTELLCSLFCCLGKEDEVPYEEDSKP